MTKLSFSNDQQLIAAFKKGAKFVVQDGTAAPAPVADIGESVGGQLTVWFTPKGKSRTYTKAFRPDGTHKLISNRTLVMVSAGASAVKPTNDSPFLKRFVNGESAYCEVTRETVEGVSFVKGAIEVLLRNGDGAERVSTSYDHEGRHRWVPARSLQFGTLPPPKVKKTLRIYAESYYGTSRYVTLEKDQILPANGRHHTLVTTIEVEV